MENLKNKPLKLESTQFHGSPSLQYLMEVKRIRKNIAGRFYIVDLPNNKKALSFLTDKGNRYIIQASLQDMERFGKWDGEAASIDIQKTGKRMRLSSGKKFPLIHIKADVSFYSKEKEKDEIIY